MSTCNVLPKKLFHFLFMVLPELLGGTLKAHCSTKQMDEPEILFFTRQILKGLNYLHSSKPPIIHLDVKGENIVLTEDKKTAKLCDMDNSREMQLHYTTPADVSHAFGTVSHMSPEMLKFDEDPRTLPPVGRTTDIWSLGCVVLEMLGKGDFFILDKNGESISVKKCKKVYFTLLIGNGHSPEIPITASPYLKSFLMEFFNRDPQKRKRADDLLGLTDKYHFDEEGICWLPDMSNASWNPRMDLLSARRAWSSEKITELILLEVTGRTDHEIEANSLPEKNSLAMKTKIESTVPFSRGSWSNDGERLCIYSGKIIRNRSIQITFAIHKHRVSQHVSLPSSTVCRLRI